MYTCPNCTNSLYLRNDNDLRGPLLPFLAGVLVTTPFLFMNNKQNNTPYYPYPQIPYYMPYSYPYPQYPQPFVYR